MSELESAPTGSLAAFIVRGDFYRWIGDLFGDRALADELRVLEGRHRAGSRSDTLAEMASAVRGRCDLADDLAVLPSR